MKIIILILILVLSTTVLSINLNNYCKQSKVKGYQTCPSKHSYKCMNQICAKNETTCTNYQVAIFSINPYYHPYFSPSFISVNKYEIDQFQSIINKITDCQHHKSLNQMILKSNVCLKSKKYCERAFSFDCGQGYCAKYKQTCMKSHQFKSLKFPKCLK